MLSMETRNKADLVLRSNAVFTGITDDIIKGGVAIKGNRIAAVGDDAFISSWIGSNTEMLNYNDELIMPGFNDAHFHLPDSSLFDNENYCVSLFDCESEEECIVRVEKFASGHPENKWIFGVGWNHWLWPECREPDRYSLDKINVDRPICLQSFDMHSAWVNSRALEITGIDSNTPDPEIGLIGRLQNGEPSGLLIDTEAVQLATVPAHALPDNTLKIIFKEFLRKANSYGITTISDVHPRGVAKINAYRIYKALEESEELSARIMFYPELTDDLSRAEQLRERFNSDNLRFCGLKQLADGVVESHTAYMLEPYSDDPAKCGALMVPEDTLRRQILNADAAGFSVRVHSIGDGAVRLCLDIFEEARKRNGENGTRHAIEHIENIQTSDIPRFRELGVIASMQPFHSVLSCDSFTQVVGEERVKRSWALRSIIGTGAKYAIGTDSPVADMNPFNNIYAAVTRKNPGGFSGNGINPDEKISMAEVLRGYTQGSAYLENMDDKIGTLEAGKLADVTVLSKNLLDVPHDEIPGTKVKLTVLNGEIVYREQ